jgi:hypothetical protein
MSLLNEVLDAAGGLSKWNTLTRFVSHLSMDGALLARRGKAGLLEEAVAEGSTRTASTRLQGFPASDCEACMEPGQIRIERLNGEVLCERSEPRPNFDEEANWDELQLSYFCCVSIWNCMTAPFILAYPGVIVEEIPATVGKANSKLHKLRALFPSRIDAFGFEQTYHFDEALLLRQVDYHVDGTSGVISDYCSAHHEFSGLVIPTLRRSVQQGAYNIAVAKIVDIEIFDTMFAA